MTRKQNQVAVLVRIQCNNFTLFFFLSAGSERIRRFLCAKPLQKQGIARSRKKHAPAKNRTERTGGGVATGNSKTAEGRMKYKLT
jgi:hypothetical protein